MTDEQRKRRDETLVQIGALSVALATRQLTDLERRHLERNQADLIRRIVAERAQERTEAVA